MFMRDGVCASEPSLMGVKVCWDIFCTCGALFVLVLGASIFPLCVLMSCWCVFGGVRLYGFGASVVRSIVLTICHSYFCSVGVVCFMIWDLDWGSAYFGCVRCGCRDPLGVKIVHLFIFLMRFDMFCNS